VSETGNAKNVEHFAELIGFVGSWGVTYQPTNDSIKLLALNSKLTSAQAAMTDVTAKRSNWKLATNDRENTFNGVRPLVTRVVQYYESTGTAQNYIDDVRSLKRKLDGTRAKTKEAPPADPPAGGDAGTGTGDGTGTATATTVSASQQSYVQLVEHLSGIIELLGEDPLYNPNEADLKVTALTALRDEMHTANQDVITASVPLSNVLGHRNEILYAPTDGLVDLALMVKKYVLAAFGNNSTEYNQIKGLEFKRIPA